MAMVVVTSKHHVILPFFILRVAEKSNNKVETKRSDDNDKLVLQFHVFFFTFTLQKTRSSTEFNHNRFSTKTPQFPTIKTPKSK